MVSRGPGLLGDMRGEVTRPIALTPHTVCMLVLFLSFGLLFPETYLRYDILSSPCTRPFLEQVVPQPGFMRETLVKPSQTGLTQ